MFDNPALFGTLPTAFCYPGKGKSADLLPPPICGETWDGLLVSQLEDAPKLILLVGQHAQAFHLGKRRKRTPTETVRTFEESGPHGLPLPVPSWRSWTWMKENPGFETEVLTRLRLRVTEIAGLSDPLPLSRRW